LKILVVSHSYVVDVNQKKIQRLAEQPGLSIVLIAPLIWRDMGRDIILHRPNNPAFQMHGLRIFFHNHLYIYHFHWLQLLKIFFRERPDLVYVEEEPQSFSSFQAILAAKLIRAKVVLLSWENLEVRFPLYKRLVAKCNISWLDAAVGGTEEALKTLRKLGFGKKGFVNPQFGLDENQFRPAKQTELKKKLGIQDRFVVGFIARMTREKGVLTMVKAAAALDMDIVFLMVGEGPTKQEAMELAGKLGVGGKFIWHGIIRHHELSDYMNCFDVFVLPSIPSPSWKEQFGHVVIEAMACQVPVIGSDCGAIPELAGEGGLIFPAGDEKALAEHIKTLYRHDELRTDLGKRGRRRVIEFYSEATIVQKLRSIFSEVMGEDERKDG
jgi:glycosyltransferase involved in cell wall biosynthesis